MKKLLLALLVSGTVIAAPALTDGASVQLNKRGSADRRHASGTHLYNATQLGAKATWDFDKSGGAANTDIAMLDKEGRKVTLPANAIITNCLIDVATQPASSTGSASIAISSSAVADLKAATFPAGYTTGAPLACIVEGTLGNMIRTSSELTLKVRTGSEALTAGKINVWVQYVLSD